MAVDQPADIQQQRPQHWNSLGSCISKLHVTWWWWGSQHCSSPSGLHVLQSLITRTCQSPFIIMCARISHECWLLNIQHAQYSIVQIDFTWCKLQLLMSETNISALECIGVGTGLYKWGWATLLTLHQTEWTYIGVSRISHPRPHLIRLRLHESRAIIRL